MNNKMIAIIAVIIVVVAAVGSYVFIAGDDGDPEARNYNGRLMVFGNANNDDYIDDEDVKVLESIVNGDAVWNKTNNPYADANHDGTIDQSDIDWVKKMMNREPMEIWYENAAHDDCCITYPIGNIVVIGSDAMRAMQILGLKEKVVGRNGSSSPDLYLDPTLNATIFNNAMEVSPSTSKIDIGLLTNLMDKTPVDVIVTGKTTLSSVEPQINKLGVDVVHMTFNDDQVGINSFITMGYLANSEETALKIAKFFDDLLADIEDKLASIPQTSRVSAISMGGAGALYCNDLETGYGSWILKAGAISPVTRDMVDGENSKTVTKGDTWHLSSIYNTEYVVYSQGYSYAYDGEYFADKYWNSYIERFSWDKMTSSNYPDSIVLINWNLYQPLGVAYLCSIFYPDVFGEDYGDNIHQKFIDLFYSDLSSVNYKASEHCFCVTYDDVKAYL